MRLKCIKYGDDISTDQIIAGKYTKTINFAELAAHAMEDLDVNFHKKIEGGGIIVAGNNFGCGSSREQAPLALKEAGVACVVAKSFARIFYRNAVNIGLPIAECDTSIIQDGDELEFEIGSDTLYIITQKKSLKLSPLPAIMVQILNDGGIERHFALKSGHPSTTQVG